MAKGHQNRVVKEEEDDRIDQKQAEHRNLAVAGEILAVGEVDIHQIAIGAGLHGRIVLRVRSVVAARSLAAGTARDTDWELTGVRMSSAADMMV